MASGCTSSPIEEQLELLLAEARRQGARIAELEGLAQEQARRIDALDAQCRASQKEPRLLPLVDARVKK